MFSNTLLYSCKNKDINKINTILNNNPTKKVLSYKSKKKCTPLFYACLNELSDVAIRLIRTHTTDCDFSAKTVNGFTAFMLSCVKNLDTVVIEMLKYYPRNCGLDETIMPPITYKNIQWMTTPLIYLCYHKKNSLVLHILNNYPELCGINLVLFGNDIKENNRLYELNILLLACENNQKEIIDCIIQNHYDYSVMNNHNDRNICSLIIKSLIKHKYSDNLKFIIDKGSLKKFSSEEICELFEYSYLNDHSDISVQLLQYIPISLFSEKNIQGSKKKSATNIEPILKKKSIADTINDTFETMTNNENDTMENNILQVESYLHKAIVRKILMIALTYGDDDIVCYILNRYDVIYKQFKECLHCFEFNNSNDGNINNYYFTSHDISELPCAYDPNGHNQTELIIQIYTSSKSVVQKMCERKLSKSLELYSTAYEFDFSQFTLEKYKANIDDVWYTTILIECIKSDELTDIAKKIINKHTDPNINMGLFDYIGENGKNVLMFAIEKMRNDIAMLIICEHFKHCDVFVVNDDGNTAMIMACIYKMEQVALKLLEYYKNDEYKEYIMLGHINKADKTALLIASENKMTNVVNIIREINDQQIIHRELELKCKEKTLATEGIKLIHKELSLKTKEDGFESKENELILTFVNKENELKLLFETKENTLKMKETTLASKEKAFNVRESTLGKKETLLNTKEQQFISKETEFNNVNACLICSDTEFYTYISIPCYHIVKLCKDCHKEYVKLTECSGCRKPMELKQCYNI